MKKLILSGIGMLSIFSIGYGQSPMTQHFSFQLQKDGNAAVELTMKMDARQWTQYKASTTAATLPVRKRDMERTLPAYLFENFKYSEDEMERTAKYTFDLVGVSEYLGDGHWRIRLEMKDPQIEKLSDNTYMLTTTTSPEEGNIQQIQKVHLPDGASGAAISKDTLGFAELRYDLPSGESRLPFALFGGGLLIAAGGGLLLVRKKFAFNMPYRFKLELKKNEPTAPQA